MNNRNDPYYEPDKATDYEWVWLKRSTVPFDSNYGKMIGLEEGEIHHEYEPVDWSGSEKFPLRKNIERDVIFNIGDDNSYLELRKCIYLGGWGRSWEGYACITKDWEFEENNDFKVPKRFIQMLERWKKFKENV